jgi:tripeptide aminopeptidase
MAEMSVSEIIAHPAFGRAVAALTLGHDRLISEIVELTQIPAPPFSEETRAVAYMQKFAELGLEDLRQDTIGNVTGLRRGGGEGLVVLAAHLDTVFPAGTDVTVRREGTRLFAPGVGDDTKGLAVLLTLARAMDAAGIGTDADLLFVGDVGEEGTGDLRGMRHLFLHGEYRDRITGFFTFDGMAMERLVTAAVGSYRYRVTFRGPGGHSLLDFGRVNPAHAMAAMVAGLAETQVPATPRTTYCASIFGGGTSINAIPEQVWVEIDLRSESPEELERLDARLRSLVDQALEQEMARASGTVTAQVTQIGARPAGATDPQARIVRASVEAITAFGFEVQQEASSTDANIPMSLGIPAVMIGTGGSGGGIHTLDEWIDVEEGASLRGLKAALAAVLGTAGLRAESAAG